MERDLSPFEIGQQFSTERPNTSFLEAFSNAYKPNSYEIGAAFGNKSFAPSPPKVTTPAAQAKAASTTVQFPKVTDPASPAAAVTPTQNQTATPAPAPSGDLVTNQFKSGLSYDEALAACGPVAAQALARYYGNNIPIGEVMRAARASGWNTAGGMNGVYNQKRMMDSLGIKSRLVTAPNWGDIARDSSTGNPVIISTPKHYYVAQAYDADGSRSGKPGAYFVGQSGLAFAFGGGLWMTADEIARQGGGINGALFADSPASPYPSVAVSGPLPN